MQLVKNNENFHTDFIILEG